MRSFPPSAKDHCSAGTQLHQSRRSSLAPPMKRTWHACAGCRCLSVALYYRLISVQASRRLPWLQLNLSTKKPAPGGPSEMFEKIRRPILGRSQARGGAHWRHRLDHSSADRRPDHRFDRYFLIPDARLIPSCWLPHQKALPRQVSHHLEEGEPQAHYAEDHDLFHCPFCPQHPVGRCYLVLSHQFPCWRSALVRGISTHKLERR